MKYRPSVPSAVALFILILFSTTSHGQDYKAVSMSLADGLSQSSVYDIIQDHSGYTWMATQDGLNRYDGTTFHVYRDEPFDTNSISSNNTQVLLCDSKGRIWAGTANNGLNLFLPASDGFQHFQAGNGKYQLSSNIITALYEDAAGNIWVGTGNGLLKLKEEGNSNPAKFVFERIPLLTSPDDTVDSKFISVILEDNNRQLWVGSYAGLFKLIQGKKGSGKPTVVWYSKKNDRISDNVVLSLTMDAGGDIWAGTRQGLNRIMYPGENIIAYNCNDKNTINMKSRYINALFTSSNGDIWLGYSDRGVQVIRAQQVVESHNRPLVFEDVSAEPVSGVLSKGAAISFWEDRITKGMIWCGFNAGGAVRLIPVTKKFNTNKLEAAPLPTAFVNGIVRLSANEIWIGTNKGLLCYDGVNKTYETVLPSHYATTYIDGDYINGMVPGDNRSLYFGAANSVFKVWRQNGKIKLQEIKLEEEAGDGVLRTLSFDEKGNVYAIRRYSISKLNKSTNKFETLINIADPERVLDRGFYYSCHFIDHKGNHWVGTSSGLEFFENKGIAGPDFTKPQTYYHHPDDTTSLRNQNILCIAEDASHQVWLGTMNGLTRVVNEYGKRRFINYSTRNGLKNNVIYAILTDSLTGHLWLSTNNGLTEFDPSGFAIATYDIHDGLQNNEFNSYAAFKAADGELFFGGIDGYTSFYPHQICRDQTPPSVLITGILLNNNTWLNLNDYQESKTIELRYKDNSFTINFIGLHYVDPQKNQYAYKLEGFQSDWIYAGNSTRVNFSQLPPGKYTFRVKAANSDGSYNTKGEMFIINIKPPFYKTIWFYLLIAAFIAMVLWGLHKYRLSMKLEQVKEVEKIRRATAADFHDELGHKLTIISWFAEILKKKIGPEQKDLRPHLDRIIEASGTLYHTMKDMLWAMDPDKDSVHDLYSQIREFGLELFDNTGVLFEAGDIPDDLKERIISPAHKRHVLLIFKEVMHNSLKHANSTATMLELVKDENLIKFRFRDNGTGFKMNGNNTGHGLNNVKRRASLINARIDVHSEGDGTVAELDVPLDNFNNS